LRPSGRSLALVLVVCIAVLMILGSIQHANSRWSDYQEGMEPYDATLDLVEQVDGNQYLRGVDANGTEYDYVVLSKVSLEWYAAHTGRLEENLTSSFHYRLTFDDVDVSDTYHNPGQMWSSHYTFGEDPPSGAETVRIDVPYALHLHTSGADPGIPSKLRHLCILTVEVWL
jgi:hypothetical protein